MQLFKIYTWLQNAKVWKSNTSSTFVYLYRISWHFVRFSSVIFFQLQTVRVYTITRLWHAKKSGLTNQLSI